MYLVYAVAFLGGALYISSAYDYCMYILSPFYVIGLVKAFY